MTIVGSKRMIVYDDVTPLEKLRIFDARVERPPHYDTFAEFHYAYHYGDMYAPYIKQEEPLKTECQHFLDCINEERTPLTGGRQGLELVQVLEASSESLRKGGAPVELFHQRNADCGKHNRTPVRVRALAKRDDSISSRVPSFYGIRVGKDAMIRPGPVRRATSQAGSPAASPRRNGAVIHKLRAR